MENIISDYLTLKDTIKEHQKAADALEQKIQLQLGFAETGLAQGYTVSWRSFNRVGSVDAKKLAAEYPAAFAACKKPDTSYRKFAIKEDKQ